MTKFEKAIKQLKKAEEKARKAQLARDKAETQFDRAMNILRPDNRAISPEWRAYCDANGLAYNYDFGDTIC